MKAPQHIDPSSNVDLLERELYLKQLQINRLLEITQAINNNLSSADLFKIYKDILSWEMRIKRFALFTREGDHWECAASTGVNANLLQLDITDSLVKYRRTANIDEPHHLLLKQFELVVPVYHKSYPIAFAFIGDIDEEANLYEQVKFITTITNIIAVAIENKRLFKRQLEQERMKRDVELAVQMQNMLIPSSLPDTDAYSFAGVYQPHQGVGGDYYDVLELDDGEVSFCIADISGKGIAAALLMSNFQANLQSLIYRDLAADKFIDQLNQSVLRITKGDKFITFFIAKYNSKTGYFRYVNAGHNPPLLLHKGELQRLDKGCTILGIFDEIPEIEMGELYIEKEALLLLYTDGLTDLRNEKGDSFEEDRVQKFVLRHAAEDPESFNEALMNRVRRYKGQSAFPDDISILTARFQR